MAALENGARNKRGCAASVRLKARSLIATMHHGGAVVCTMALIGPSTRTQAPNGALRGPLVCLIYGRGKGFPGAGTRACTTLVVLRSTSPLGAGDRIRS